MELTYKAAIAIYKAAHLEHLRGKSTMTDEALNSIVKNAPHDFKTTNGLTTAIIKYVTYIGGFANRINVSGRVIKTKSYTTGGGGIIEGKAVRIPSATKKGSPDISIIFQSLSIQVEVKNINTKDRTSSQQIKVKSQIEAAGGLYYIAESFEGFISWWIDTIEKQNPALSA